MSKLFLVNYLDAAGEAGQWLVSEDTAEHAVAAVSDILGAVSVVSVEAV